MEEYVELEDAPNYVITKDAKVYNKRNLNHPLCQWQDATGYYTCVVRVDKKKKWLRIHRLMAKAFIPNPENLPQVNHIDGDKTNNSLNNLEWVSNKENTKHGYDNNLYLKTSGGISVNVYSKKDGRLVGVYDSIRSLSKELGVNRKTVSNILNGTKKTNNYDYIFEFANKDEINLSALNTSK